MRILIVAEGDSWGGIETHLMSLLPNYSHDQSVECECLLFYHGELSRSLEKIGIKVTVVPKTSLFATIQRIRGVLTRGHYDIVHMHSLVAAFYVILSTLMLQRPPLVWTLHGKAEKLTGIRWIKDKISRSLVYPVMRSAKRTRLICVSDEIVNWAKNLYHIPLEIIVVIKNGFRGFELAPDIDGYRQKLNLPTDDLLIVIVGRLVDVKGHIYALMAMETLLRSPEYKARLLLVGDGPLSAVLAEYCASRNIVDHIHFLGARTDAKELMAMSDIFLIPSLDEGIPYSLLEAMYLEKPVVASAVGGIPEVISDRYNGLLVKARSPLEIAAAIQLLVEDASLAVRIGKNARKTVEDKFSSQVMADHTLAVYRSLLT